MKTEDKTCRQFINELSSAAPAPGGGGAAAMCGALAVSLGNMVGALTVGKKKYADAEDEIKRLMKESERLKGELLALVDEDARCFEPLSASYRLPKSTQEECSLRAEAIEENLKLACSAPLKIMEACAEATELISAFAEKGSVTVLSDAGCGASLCRGALAAAAMNVYINTKAMKDREYAGAVNARADELLEVYSAKAQGIEASVLGKLRGQP